MAADGVHAAGNGCPAAQVAMAAIETAQDGEVVVPMLPSCKVSELALAVDERADWDVTGMRPGEKLHEEMIPEAELEFTRKDATARLYYVGKGGDGALKAPYASDTNKEKLRAHELRRLIKDVEKEGLLGL